MLRHCVLFNWNENATAEAKAAISAGLDKLAELDMVSAYQHGPDAGLSDGNWDYVLVGDFASTEDYQAYATNPFHLELIAELIKPNISGRAGAQYEV